MPKNDFTTKEDNSILNYVAKKARNRKQPFMSQDLWKRYIKASKSSRSEEEVKNRFREVLAPNLKNYKQFDNHTKIQILYTTKFPVRDADFLKHLRESATQLHSNSVGQIMHYKRKWGTEEPEVKKKKNSNQQESESESEDESEPEKKAPIRKANKNRKGYKRGVKKAKNYEEEKVETENEDSDKTESEEESEESADEQEKRDPQKKRQIALKRKSLAESAKKATKIRESEDSDDDQEKNNSQKKEPKKVALKRKSSARKARSSSESEDDQEEKDSQKKDSKKIAPTRKSSANNAKKARKVSESEESDDDQEDKNSQKKDLKKIAPRRTISTRKARKSSESDDNQEKVDYQKKEPKKVLPKRKSSAKKTRKSSESEESDDDEEKKDSQKKEQKKVAPKQKSPEKVSEPTVEPELESIEIDAPQNDNLQDQEVQDNIEMAEDVQEIIEEAPPIVLNEPLRGNIKTNNAEAPFVIVLDDDAPNINCSSKMVFTNLLNLVAFLGSNKLADVQNKLKEAWEQPDREIPMERVLLGLETIFMASNSATFNKNVEMMSCKYLLKFLKTILMNLELHSLQKEVETAIAVMGEEDIKIPSNNVRVAIEVALNLIC